MNNGQSSSKGLDTEYQEVIFHLEESLALVEKKYADQEETDPALTQLYLHLRVCYQLLGGSNKTLLKIGDKMGLNDPGSNIQDAEFTVLDEETQVDEASSDENKS